MTKPTRVVAALIVALLPPAASAFASPLTLAFTAGDVRSVMEAQGAALHDSTYQWGLWAIDASLVVSGGGYDIVGGSVTGVPGNRWTFDEFGSVATFHALPRSEHFGVAAHDLYMIADQPVDTFQSYRFDNTIEDSPGRSAFTGICDPLGDPTGCNFVHLVPDAAVFTINFNLDPGVSWIGWQFLVDGSKYYRPESVPAGSGQSLWVADFIGGDSGLDNGVFGDGGRGGGLLGNTGSGFQVLEAVPEPGTLSLLALGVGVAAIARHRARK